MNNERIRKTVLSALVAIAPEAKGQDLPPNADLREELDLDSMDFLNLVTALHEELGVDIPEADYGKVATLAAMTDYIAAELASKQG